MYFENEQRHFSFNFWSKRNWKNVFSLFFPKMVFLFHFKFQNNKQTNNKAEEQIWGLLELDFCRFFHQISMFLEWKSWIEIEISFFTEILSNFIHLWRKTRNFTNVTILAWVKLTFCCLQYLISFSHQLMKSVFYTRKLTFGHHLDNFWPSFGQVVLLNLWVSWFSSKLFHFKRNLLDFLSQSPGHKIC